MAVCIKRCTGIRMRIKATHEMCNVSIYICIVVYMHCRLLWTNSIMEMWLYIDKLCRELVQRNRNATTTLQRMSMCKKNLYTFQWALQSSIVNIISFMSIWIQVSKFSSQSFIYAKYIYMESVVKHKCKMLQNYAKSTCNHFIKYSHREKTFSIWTKFYTYNFDFTGKGKPIQKKFNLNIKYKKIIETSFRTD